MQKPLLALVFLLGATASLSANELKIEGANISRDIPCNNQDVSISGTGHKIVLTGTCDDITVNGSKHHITFEKADELDVSGAENTVIGGEVDDIDVSVAKNTIKATLVPDDDTAEVEVSGANHTLDLTLKGKTKFEVTGAEHEITWTAATGIPDPVIEAVGISNTITRK